MRLAERLAAVALVIICCCAARAQQQPPPGAARAADEAPKKANSRPDARQQQAPAEPFDKATVAQMSGQCVRLETAAGLIEIEMLAEAAPESVRNFLNLVATGALDTTTFSRVVRGFVVQGGNLSTREKVTVEIAKRARRTVPDEPNAVKHVRGVVSMARSDEPNSATTHFFILVGEGSHLDGKFAAFGRVTRGMEAVDQMNAAELDGETPKNPVRINRATVAPCPAPAPQPSPAPQATPRP